MPPWSRRDALQAAGSVLLAALAGCNEGTNRPRRGPKLTPITDVTLLKVRHTEPVPMVIDSRLDGDENGGDGETPRRTPSPRDRGRLMIHVTDVPGTGESRVVYPDDTPGTAAIRSFLAETDYETESVYLTQSPIPECYDRHLNAVYREGDGVDAEFCRQLRPADVACGTDVYDMVAFAIRLPFPGDGSAGLGQGGSSDCRGPDGEILEPDEQVTVGETGGENA